MTARIGAPLLPEYLTAFPEVDVELTLSDRMGFMTQSFGSALIRCCPLLGLTKAVNCELA
jgi:hypothetical protein